jgi:hypothetical protein
MQNMKMQDEQRLFVATASASVMAGLVTKSRLCSTFGAQ